MRLLGMAVMSADGEAQIIFLARDGRASANHVRGRSELDNFENQRWSIAGRQHFPVTLYQFLCSFPLGLYTLFFNPRTDQLTLSRSSRL
jgi:hypothetical protein